MKEDLKQSVQRSSARGTVHSDAGRRHGMHVKES